MNYKDITHNAKYKCGIYRIINIDTNKMYIGSSKNIGDRWMSHIYALNRGNHSSKEFQYDWNKYGEESFKFEILELVKEENLLPTEQKYINKYDAFNNGYNSAKSVGKHKNKRISTERLIEYYYEELVPRLHIIELNNLGFRVITKTQERKFENMSMYKNLKVLNKCCKFLDWYINSDYLKDNRITGYLFIPGANPRFQISLYNEDMERQWIKTYCMVKDQVILRYFDDFR